jgi:hypothetical protein
MDLHFIKELEVPPFDDLQYVLLPCYSCPLVKRLASIHCTGPSGCLFAFSKALVQSGCAISWLQSAWIDARVLQRSASSPAAALESRTGKMPVTSGPTVRSYELREQSWKGFLISCYNWVSFCG